VIRLIAALALGAIIGWERERAQKPAGLRTHMLVALGAAVFILLGVGVLLEYQPELPGSRIDPTRVIEGVVTGIGFLGAGSIIQSRGSVQGLTTGASVWIAGAVGVACGLGAYWIAGLATLFALATLALVVLLEPKVATPNKSD
jgi:putative Mg2+ transporter-C (MgtC) family protein